MGVCVGKSSHQQEPATKETPKSTSSQTNSTKPTVVVEQPPEPKEIKLLLLGAGESGKSTVWKQMKMIHVEGFDDNERDEFYKPAVVENVVQLLHGLLQIARKTNVPVSDQHQEIITELASDMMYNEKTPALYSKLLDLWEDKGIQEMAANNITQLSLDLVDTAPYWIDHYKRILTPEFSPTVEDIIKCRTKTTGIADLLFEMDGVEFRLIDVGGQRSERKKWISCFQNLTAILFVVALSEYDQKLREDSDVNRMHESMKLFRGVVANEALHHVHMILFFNKDDIFKEKIKKSKLSDTFPDYDGPNDYESAYDFIKNKFTSMNTNPDRTIHTQTTVATNIENIRKVMDEVKVILIGSRKTGGM